MNKLGFFRMVDLAVLIIIIPALVLNACASTPDVTQSLPSEEGDTTSPSPGTTESPAPETEIVPAISIEEATLFVADFESGIPAGISGLLHLWETRLGAGENTIYCNDLNDDWTSFFFGSEDWSDYAFEADIQLISSDPEYGYELYARFGEGGEGYRASVYDSYASMSFYPPSLGFGGNNAVIAPSEWHTLRVEVVNQAVRYFVDDDLIVTVEDDHRASGQAGIGASPGTEICVDNIRQWAIDEHGPIARENVPGASNPNDPLAKYEGDCQFCFVNGSEPDMPIFNPDTLGHMPQPDDPREQIVLDETFSVGAGEEVVFEDKIIWVRPKQRGDIVVYGTLIVRNSLLLWDQTEHQQTYLLIKNGGNLIVESSFAFGTNPFWVNWEYEDGSTILFDHFVGDPWTSISGSIDYTAINTSSVRITFLVGIHDTTVRISDAHHVWFELYPPAGEHDITLPTKYEWVDWEISDLWPNTSVEVENSYLYERDIALFNDTHVTVRDTPDGFGLGWGITRDSAGFVDCEIRGLGDPEKDEGVFYEYKVWDLPCNNSSLTVISSALLRAWPVTWGNVRLRVYDSNLVDPRNYGGSTASMEIYNSTIDHMAAYDGGRVYLENTRIRYDIEVKDANSVIYGFDVSPREPDREIEIFEVDGGSYIELDSPGPPWE